MYPPRYSPLTDFVRNEQLGNDIPAAAVQAEFTRVAESLSHVIALLKRTHTSDGKLKLDQAVRLRDVITQSALGTGNGVQTVFNFLAQIDPTVDLVRVFVNNVLTTPLSITASAITFSAAPANGQAVTVDVYTNLGGVIDRLQSVVQNEGASLIGIEDLAANFTAADVEGALAELAASLTALETAIGDVGGFVLRDGTRGLTGQWELNAPSTVTIPPAPAAGALVMGTPADTNILTISDGVTSFVFEFDNNAAVTSPRIPVAIGGTPTITATNLVNAVNAAPLAIRAASVGPNVTFTHEIPYALGNQTIAFSGTGITGLVGMAGGVDGIFSSGQYKTHYRIRNCPPSLREGDVVVHQQLATVLAQVTAALQAFLRLDGSNEMVNDLDMGNNQVIDMAAGTASSHGATVGQVETLIATAQNSKLSLNGLKDTALEGTLTGPVTFGQTATAVATTDQTTTPASVTVPTLSGIPKPAVDDHVANKRYVDERVASVLDSDPTILPAFNLDGDGLGGAGLANINAGGDFYFEDLIIAAAQTPTLPTRVFVEGSLTIQNTGSISAGGPVEIICTGDVTIQGAVSATHLIIRCGGILTVAAAITTEVGGTYWYRYSEKVPARFGGPVDTVGDPIPTYTNGRPSKAEQWRAVLLQSSGPITISANITSDDVFIHGGNNVTVSSTVRGRWWMRAASASDVYQAEYPAGSSTYRVIGWRDTVRHYLPVTHNGSGSGIDLPGGTGGTGGGNGGTSGPGTPAGASVWTAAQRPYLFPTYELARGGPGGSYNPSGETSKGGGRISVYAEGAMVLTGASFNVSGGDGWDTNHDTGGGGAGSCRLVSKGLMTDGNITADGGESGAPAGFAGGGGGGLAAMVASSYAGTQSRSVDGGDVAAGDGLSIIATLTAAQIEALNARGLFGVFPDAA